MTNHQTRALIGWSAPMDDLRAEIRNTGPTDMTVMILGERGTGKELVAREIHLKSRRADAPFIQLNCSALPETLVETELFGCEKGAFTGAEFRRGRFEQAHGGTLFLDEIGELSLTAQPKLLRVLQEKLIDRVGGQRPIPADFRLVVATNRNLEEMMRAQRFREDLYDRLNIAAVHIPPLRERPEDIAPLAEYFIGVYVQQAYRMIEGLERPVLDLFQQYWWPGNVRELENVVQRAVFRAQSARIGLQDLPFDFIKNASKPRSSSQKYHDKMQAYSRELIVDAVTDCRGNRSKAIAQLDLSRAQFYRLAKKHGLDWIVDENRGSRPRVFD